MENEQPKEEYDENGEKKHWYDGAKDVLNKVWNFRAVAKRTEFATLSAAFTHKNKHALVVLADPETDVIFVSYDDQHAVNRITDVTGRSMKVVKKALDGREESIMNLVTYVASAIKDNHEAILKRKIKPTRFIFQKDKNMNKFKYYDQVAKTNEQIKIDKSEAKRKREAEMAKIQREQEKTDLKSGLKKVGPLDTIKNLFRRKIIK